MVCAQALHGSICGVNALHCKAEPPVHTDVQRRHMLESVGVTEGGAAGGSSCTKAEPGGP